MNHEQGLLALLQFAALELHAVALPNPSCYAFSVCGADPNTASLSFLNP